MTTRRPDLAPLTAAIEAAGINLYLAVEDKWYGKGDEEIGQRQFVVADPDGYLLRFAQMLGTRARQGR